MGVIGLPPVEHTPQPLVLTCPDCRGTHGVTVTDWVPYGDGFTALEQTFFCDCLAECEACSARISEFDLQDGICSACMDAGLELVGQEVDPGWLVWQALGAGGEA